MIFFVVIAGNPDGVAVTDPEFAFTGEFGRPALQRPLTEYLPGISRSANQPDAINALPSSICRPNQYIQTIP